MTDLKSCFKNTIFVLLSIELENRKTLQETLQLENSFLIDVYFYLGAFQIPGIKHFNNVQIIL